MEAALALERSAASRKASARPRLWRAKAALRPSARRAKIWRPWGEGDPLQGEANLRALLFAMEPHLEQIQA